MFAGSKRLLVALLVILGAVPVSAQTTQKWLGVAETPVATGTRWYVPTGGVDTGSSEAIGQMVVPVASTVTKLKVFAVVAPDNGAGTQTWTFMLREATADTAATCVITEAETSCEWTGSEALAAQSLVTLAVIPANTPLLTGTALYWSIESTQASGKSFVGYSTPAGFDTVAGTEEFAPIQGEVNISATETNFISLWPIAATLTDMCVNLTASPGTGDTRTFTIRINGVNDNTLQVSYSGAADSGVKCDTASIAINPGDRIQYHATSSGSAIAAARGSFGLAYTPTTTNEFVLMHTSEANITSTFAPLMGNSTHSATETETAQLGSADFAIKQCYGYLTVDPGVGTTRSFVLRHNGSDASTPFTCTVAAGSQTCSSTAGSFTPSADSRINLDWNVSGSPAASRGNAGCRAAMASAGSGSAPSSLPLTGVGTAN